MGNENLVDKNVVEGKDSHLDMGGVHTFLAEHGSILHMMNIVPDYMQDTVEFPAEHMFGELVAAECVAYNHKPFPLQTMDPLQTFATPAHEHFLPLAYVGD